MSFFDQRSAAASFEEVSSTTQKDISEPRNFGQLLSHYLFQESYRNDGRTTIIANLGLTNVSISLPG